MTTKTKIDETLQPTDEVFIWSQYDETGKHVGLLVDIPDDEDERARVAAAWPNVAMAAS